MINCKNNNSNRFYLPFFVYDLVTLTNGHLLSLDLKHVDKTDPDHTGPVWQRLMPLFERWRAELPDGGPIPEEAQPYFSPAFLWTRIPLGGEGDVLIDRVIRPALRTTSALPGVGGGGAAR